MNKRKPSAGRRVGIILAAAVLIAGIGYFVYEYFQVRSVLTAGNARFTSAYVQTIADVAEGTHMLQVSEEQIRQNIQGAEPYLQVVSVVRRLPDTVIVEVVERRPAAFLPYSNDYLLIDISTDILEILETPDSLDCPVVEGISVENPQVGSEIETADAFKIAIMQEILQDLDSRNLFPLIAVVDLSNINNIRMESRDGLAIRLGQAERIGDKIKWVQNRLPALEGQSDGLLDVSSGSFATYTMFDGSQGTARALSSPSPQPESSDGAASGEAEESDGAAPDPSSSGSAAPSGGSRN